MNTGFHVHARYTTHVTPAAHPERPERIECLLPLADRARELGVVLFDSERQATTDELDRVHTPGHIRTVASTEGLAGVMLDPDTHTSPHSYQVARHAAGALLDLVDAVVDGRLDNGFAAVRPPGHHAEAGHAMGFCLFNNIAIAAHYLRTHHGLDRVLVVDWDVHHGNGTQHAFYRDPGVLFVSLHQYPFYPGTGAMDETGEGAGAGYTVNVPFPGGFSDSDYLSAFDRIIVPVARRFEPQFVLISAGFDAHWSDPLANMHLSEKGFLAMAERVLAVAREFASDRCVAVLEGGYNLKALASCVEAQLRAMSAFDGAAPGDAVTSADSAGIVDRVIAIHRERWGL
jgi:acetoin utilization deacetylase AcuC-like enzyme